MIRLLAAIALVGATVHTGEGPPLVDATLVIEGSRVQAVGAGVAPPADAQIVDVAGSIITPGFVDAVSRVGLVEVASLRSKHGATLPSDADPVRAALRAADTFDPRSQLLPVARAGGLTSVVAVPAAGLVRGTSVWVDLRPRDAVRKPSVALHVDVRGRGLGRGGRAVAFLRLRELLEDARQYHGNRGAYIRGDLRELSVSARDLQVLVRALDRQLPVVFHVDRAADILTVLELARSERLRAVLAGALEGWSVADVIAAAGVPVILDPLANLPVNLDALHVRDDAARRLHEAGVSVAFSTLGESHKAHRLRFAAGNAVAQGFPADAAIAAISRVPAQIFGMADTGTLRAGARANLVVWNGDPLDVSSWPTQVYIEGRPTDLTTRQDRLAMRYRPAP